MIYYITVRLTHNKKQAKEKPVRECCRFKSWIFSSFTYFSNMLCAVKLRVLGLMAYWYTGSAYHQIPQSYSYIHI